MVEIDADSRNVPFPKNILISGDKISRENPKTEGIDGQNMNLSKHEYEMEFWSNLDKDIMMSKRSILKLEELADRQPQADWIPYFRNMYKNFLTKRCYDELIEKKLHDLDLLAKEEYNIQENEDSNSKTMRHIHTCSTNLDDLDVELYVEWEQLDVKRYGWLYVDDIIGNDDTIQL